MKITQWLLITAGSLNFCSAAHAEWILSLYSGTSRTSSSDLEIRQPSTGSDARFESVHWEPRPFEDAPYYGIRIGYVPQAAPRFGASLDFTHYKMYAETERSLAVRGNWDGAPVNESAPLNTRIADFEISHGVNLTGVNFHYRFNIQADVTQRRWQPHVGVGVVTYVPHAEGIINNLSTHADYQQTSLGYQLLAGTEYRLFKRVSFLLEAKFDAGELKIDLEPDIRAETQVRTLHAIAGIALYF